MYKLNFENCCYFSFFYKKKMIKKISMKLFYSKNEKKVFQSCINESPGILENF